MRTSERTQVIKFLKDHVIGKTVVAAPVSTYTDQGRIEGVYEDQTFFSNLVEKADGFCFDLTAIFMGTLYELDKGQRVKSEGSLNAVRVYRYEMTERKSSGRLVGFAWFVSSTNTQPDPFSGIVFLARMWLESEALVVQETQAGYADVAVTGGAFKPIASDGKYRYAVEDGKLVVHYQQTTFDVDPETLMRTPTQDKFPVQVSMEIGFPPLVVHPANRL
jgi:hypothetical protein